MAPKKTTQNLAETEKTSKKGQKKAKAEGKTKEKKLSALDAAAKLLAETGEPMNCQDMIKGMAEKGYWTSPGGQTPHATIYTAVTELPKRGLPLIG
jgi:hypothetical protein